MENCEKMMWSICFSSRPLRWASSRIRMFHFSGRKSKSTGSQPPLRLATGRDSSWMRVIPLSGMVVIR
ncbi:hypothetical protein D3C81_2306170 [compost metagenome]